MDVSDHLRLEALIEWSDEIASLAISVREAYRRGSLPLGDAHFESLALIGREIRRTRAEMSDRKETPHSREAA